MGGSAIGRTMIRDPALQRLRALKVVELRVTGHSYEEIAKYLRCSMGTVKNILKFAEKAELIVDAEDKILNELVPLAHTAIKDALTEGNAKIAVEVMKGIGLFGSKASKTTPANSSNDEDLASYISKLRSEDVIELEPAGTNLAIADGEVTAIEAGASEGLLLLANAAPAADPEGTADGSSQLHPGVNGDAEGV